MTSTVLQIDGLEKRFGGLHVTHDVSFSMNAGDRLALIGPNGAGKTTLVNLISGVLKPDAGCIAILGEKVTHSKQEYRVKSGLVRTFQITTLAQHLPVQRQIELALFEREGLTASPWRSVDAYPTLTQEALSILDTLGLIAFAGIPTGRLAYGDQRLIEMGLALALRPKVLLLDEPMAGVPKADGARLLEALMNLSDSLAVMIIEHDMDLVFNFAQRIIVLAEGKILAAGTPNEIRKNALVKAAYLGHTDD
ncbi:MAG: ABC transporter ATP-binding protein [Burkholderiaceae bacterium]